MNRLTRNWETKDKILKLLNEKPMTLTDIAKRLDLAPSTVSQHIGELLDIGAIKQTADQFSRKWIYYEPIKSFDKSNIKQKGNLGIGIGTGIAVIVIIAIAAIVLMRTASPSGTTQYYLQLTDPPQVPVGTTSLVATYTSVRLHETFSNGTGTWINSSESGSVDLMSLVNVSQIIAEFQVSANAIVDKAQLDISSANITINGTTYPVTIANPVITVNIQQNATSSNSSSILVDLSPTVVTIFTSNSTVFVMVPSVTAVLIPGKHLIKINVGERNSLNGTEKMRLSSEIPNITITNLQLGADNNVTSMTVTVKDNSNKSVNLSHVELYGKTSVNFVVNSSVYGNGNYMVQTQMQPCMMPFGCQNRFGANYNSGGNGGGFVSAFNNGTIINITGMWNASKGVGGGVSARISSIQSSIANLTNIQRNEINEGVMISRLNAIDFVVLSNGTLALAYEPPFDTASASLPICINPLAEAGANASSSSNYTNWNANIALYCRFFNESGYTLQPGQSVTLEFSGYLNFGGPCTMPVPTPIVAAGHDSNSGMAIPNIRYFCPLNVGIVQGVNYTVDVIGSMGAFASANVTAS